MKPILFEENETKFTSNGLGRLSDAASCIVTEERNGLYELEMTYPVSGIHYKELKEERLLLARHDDTQDLQPFRIYKITRPISGIVTVNARHIAYQLSKVTVMPCAANNCASALKAMKEHSEGDNPFEVWTDKTTEAAFSVEKPSTFRSLLGGVQGSILDAYGGGEYEWDRYTVKLHQNRGADAGVTIRYGKNLTDVTKTTDTSDVWTGIVPFWYGSSDNTEVLVTLPERAVFADTKDSYYYRMVVPVDLTEKFENRPTEEQLRNAAQSYINNNAQIGIPTSIDVSFAALWQTEEYRNVAPLQRLRLCDTLTVHHKALGVENKAKITAVKYNVLLERYDEMTIGDVRTSLSDSIKELAKEMQPTGYITKSAMEQAIDHATEILSGGLGGNVIFHLTAEGKPDEILVMDKDSIDAAVQVLRINKNGIGFSSNGYNGPYRSAWTLDGHFVADFITTGTLNASLIKTGELDASLIKTGAIQIKKGDKETFYADADTGVVRIVADSFSLSSGATIESIAEGKAGDALQSAKDYADDLIGDGLTQQSIFNKLTNNGQTQGIYLKDGKVYINAAYIGTGTLADAGNNTTFNLSTGELTIKKGSINLGNGAFTVSQAGAMHASSADISGSFFCGSASSYYVSLASGCIKAGYGSDFSATIDFSAQFTGVYTGRGLKITSNGAIALDTNELWIHRTDVALNSYVKGSGKKKVAYKNGSGDTAYLYFVNGILCDTSW